MLSAGAIPDAWGRSAVAAVPPHGLLLVTDFDGTLAEVVPDPSRSIAFPQAIAALRRLAGALAGVIVLSSRTRAQLEALVPVPGVILIGDSGLPPPNASERATLDTFNSAAGRVLGNAPGAWLEVKQASTTVHYRGAPVSSEEMLALLRPILKTTGLEGSAGRRVIEVHVPHAGKGSALAGLIESSGCSGVVCLGDDENDRSMFDYVSRLDIPHLCVGVSSDEAPPDLFARCDLLVSGPRDAAALLSHIAHWAEAD